MRMTTICCEARWWNYRNEELCIDWNRDMKRHYIAFVDSVDYWNFQLWWSLPMLRQYYRDCSHPSTNFVIPYKIWTLATSSLDRGKLPLSCSHFGSILTVWSTLSTIKYCYTTIEPRSQMSNDIDHLETKRVSNLIIIWRFDSFQLTSGSAYVNAFWNIKWQSAINSLECRYPHGVWLSLACTSSKQIGVFMIRS